MECDVLNEGRCNPVGKHFLGIGSKMMLHGKFYDFCGFELQNSNGSFCLRNPSDRPINNLFVSSPAINRETKRIGLPFTLQSSEHHPPLFDCDAQVIRPSAIGFSPKEEWHDQVYSLKDLRDRYFRKRNSRECKFIEKLRNALRITSIYPLAFAEIGVILVTSNVLKVSVPSFATFLGINQNPHSLIHKQGVFHKYGFEDISLQEIKHPKLSKQVDGVDVFLLVDNSRVI